ncbi:MAG: cytochrome c3 family protein [Methanosarcinales archaeon]
MKSKKIMCIILILFLFFLSYNILMAYAEVTEVSCYRCHVKEVKQFQNSIHDKKNITCIDCHGGNATVMTGAFSMNPSEFIGEPKRVEISAFCGRCHAREYELYNESIHWKRIKEGYPEAATCIDCHGAHNAKASKNPESPTYKANIPAMCARCHSNKEMMSIWYYGVKSDRFDTYKESYHWKALEKGYIIVAVCSDCHENHNPREVNDPKSSVYPTNLPRTCEKKGCHESGTFDAKVSIGFVHDKESIHSPELRFDKSLLSEKAKAYFLGPIDLAYFIGIFFKILTYTVIGALVGFVILEIIYNTVKKLKKR